MDSIDKMRIAKMRYELLGEEIDFIAADLGLSSAAIKESSKNWTRRLPPLPENLPAKAGDLSVVAEDLAETYRSKLSILSLLKADYFNARCTSLEYLLLLKTHEALAQLDTSDEMSHRRLQVLSAVVKSIRDAQLYSEIKEKIQEELESKINVSIIQNFGDKSQTVGNA
jgi:hypothetical protein